MGKDGHAVAWHAVGKKKGKPWSGFPLSAQMRAYPCASAHAAACAAFIARARLSAFLAFSHRWQWHHFHMYSDTLSYFGSNLFVMICLPFLVQSV